MNLYLDCEFNEFRGALISMALVADDGREWYEVVPCKKPGAWVAQNVMPVLGKTPLPNPKKLSVSLAKFLRKFDRVHIVADWPEDIAHFCDALIVGQGEMIGTPQLTMEVRFDIDTSESAIPHNALADARALAQAVRPKPKSAHLP